MTTVLSGLGSLSKIKDVCGQFRANKILLLTGKTSYIECGAKSIVDAAFGDHIVAHFDDFDVNPKIKDAERSAELAAEFNADLIIGLGGGSVMDMAKLTKAFLTAPEQSKKIAKGELAVSDSGIPVLMVPTTAGSGSEATHFAVVYIGHDKYSVSSECLLPDAVILDGSLIVSASKYQLGCNGLDALAQAIESAWAVGSTQKSREYSFRAVSLCVKHLQEVMGHHASDDALQGMMEAANLAGKAINISKTTAAHAWSYGITSTYGTPHGHAVWLTLPKIFELHAQAHPALVIDRRGASHLRNIMARLMDILNIPSPDKSENFLRKYMNSIGLEDQIHKIGANTRQQRRRLSEMVNVERMRNNPVDLTSFKNFLFDF